MNASAKPRLVPVLALSLLVIFSLSVWLGPSPSIGMWLMLVLPLVMLLPGLRENKPRSLQWLGFVVLFYFTTGVLQTFSDSTLQKVLGMLTIICCFSLFLTAIVTLRRLRTTAPNQGK